MRFSTQRQSISSHGLGFHKGSLRSGASWIFSRRSVTAQRAVQQLSLRKRQKLPHKKEFLAFYARAACPSAARLIQSENKEEREEVQGPPAAAGVLCRSIRTELQTAAAAAAAEALAARHIDPPFLPGRFLSRRTHAGLPSPRSPPDLKGRKSAPTPYASLISRTPEPWPGNPCADTHPAGCAEPT